MTAPRPETPRTARLLSNAEAMGVMCCGCNTKAKPRRVLGYCYSPQYNTTNFGIVEFACDTPDCGDGIQVEVDDV